jgi:hypothetical protein
MLRVRLWRLMIFVANANSTARMSPSADSPIELVDTGNGPSARGHFFSRTAADFASGSKCDPLRCNDDFQPFVQFRMAGIMGEHAGVQSSRKIRRIRIITVDQSFLSYKGYVAIAAATCCCANRSRRPLTSTIGQTEAASPAAFS